MACEYDRPKGASIPSLADYPRGPADLKCPFGGRYANCGDIPNRQGLVSIITVTFNSIKTLGRTIDSVATQSYHNIEYIVVDGGSTDGTVDLLRNRSGDIDLWISERDRGISDAFNKGIALARGDFVLLVNSDDWIEPHHVKTAVAALEESNAQFVFGNLAVHTPAGVVDYLVIGDSEYERCIRHSMPDINHPSVVCRREVYERCGLYDCSLGVAMDYEWLLRCYASGVRGKYVDALTSHMLGTGVSNWDFGRSIAEVRVISTKYGYPKAAASARYVVRFVKLGIRKFIERRISARLAQRMRAMLHKRIRLVEFDDHGLR